MTQVTANINTTNSTDSKYLKHFLFYSHDNHITPTTTTKSNKTTHPTSKHPTSPPNPKIQQQTPPPPKEQPTKTTQHLQIEKDANGSITLNHSGISFFCDSQLIKNLFWRHTSREYLQTWKFSEVPEGGRPECKWRDIPSNNWKGQSTTNPKFTYS